MFRCKDNRRGFTLLEVMIALAIIAISFVVILHSHSLSIERASQAKNILISSLLAQKKIAETELLGYSALKDDRGSFNEYPQFLWQRKIYDTPVEDLKKAVLYIAWGEGEEKVNSEFVTFIAKAK